MDGNYIYTVTSDWVSNQVSSWLEELITSQQVNMLTNDGNALPININETSVEIQKIINQGLLQYIFTFTSAYSINTQRG